MSRGLFINHKKIIIGIATLMAVVYGANKLCAALDNKPAVTGFDDYAGSATCISCHKQICDSQMLTAHYFTSALAAGKYIKGSFEKGNNLFIFNKFLQVSLDSSNGHFTQTAFASGVPYEAENFDVVVGSGRKGQTYLYWNNNSLYQLPVSYYTPFNSWCNSPGFPANFIKFDRMVPARCIECHGTYAATTLAGSTTLFDSLKMIYGVTCERCHGAAAKHVAYYKTHPADTLARFIIKIQYLSRQQQLDACAFCHSGARQQLQPAFSFQTGDVLANYSLPNYNTDSVSMLDVHGNQFGLLQASKCFKASEMTCSSCHNTHHYERNAMALYSQRCQSCHAGVQHTDIAASVQKSQAFINNCIDCHMPVLPSNKIVLQLSGAQKMEPDFVRTHRIAVYADQTKQWLKVNR